jgi:hypothetical protein
LSEATTSADHGDAKRESGQYSKRGARRAEFVHLHGIVMSAELAENPPGSDIIEMTLRIQGVGSGQPRRVVIPFDLLLSNPSLEPELIAGHAFQAEVQEAFDKRWVVTEITFADRRVLRSEGG